MPSAAVAGGYPDVLTFLLAKKLREEHGEELRRAVIYFSGGGTVAGASGGTLASRGAMSNASDETRKLMADPFALGGFVPSFDRNGIKEMTVQTGTGKVSHKVRREDTDAQLSKISQCPYTGEGFSPESQLYGVWQASGARRTCRLVLEIVHVGLEVLLLRHEDPEALERALRGPHGPALRQGVLLPGVHPAAAGGGADGAGRCQGARGALGGG